VALGAGFEADTIHRR